MKKRIRKGGVRGFIVAKKIYNFIFLGVVLYFIIIPIFCMLWHIVDYK